jgi:hypothetical protein
MFPRVLRAFLFGVSALALVAHLVVGIRLMTRHDVLDPIEVSVLEHAGRMAQGGALYSEPARTDEPSLMPGFPFAVSALVRMFDADLWEPRLVAILASLLLTWLVLAIVRLETESWTLAVAGAASVLMGYGLLAEPPGVARPETLMLLCALLGLWVLRVTTRLWGALLAAVLIGAACFTQQSAMWFVAAAMFTLAIDDRKRLLAFTLTSAVVIGGGYVALSRLLGPWFNFNVFDEPLRALAFRPAAPLHFIGDHLLGKLAVPTLAAVLSFAMPTPPWRGKGGIWMCAAIAAAVGGVLGSQATGFGPPSLIPSIVVLAIVGPISMQRVTRHLSAYPGATRVGGQVVVLAALALQFIVFLSCVSQSRWFPGSFDSPSARPRPAATTLPAPGDNPAS